MNKLEVEVLRFLLTGDNPFLEGLRLQIDELVVQKRELSGSGFFTSFINKSKVNSKTIDEFKKELKFGDVHAEIDGLQFGAGFLLYVESGKITMLEGYSYDEPWPEKCDKFSLSFVNDKRDYSFLSES